MLASIPGSSDADGDGGGDAAPQAFVVAAGEGEAFVLACLPARSWRHARGFAAALRLMPARPMLAVPADRVRCGLCGLAGALAMLRADAGLVGRGLLRGEGLGVPLGSEFGARR